MSHKVPEPLLRNLREGHRFLLTSHVHPDGDAIGSEIGMARLLQQLGKGSTIWNRDPAPQVYSPLPGVDSIHVGEDPPPGFPEIFDAVIVLECPSLDRTGLEEHFGTLPRLNLDHHLGNQQYGKINWVDSAAPAVGVMVFRIAKALNLVIDQSTANALYLALHTDTGGFRFSNTTPEAFAAAAELTEAGAEPAVVAQWLYESQPESSVRLQAEALQSLELHADGRVATIWLTREMALRAKAQAGDSEGLIDYPRSIGGVEAVALFRELAPDGSDGPGFKVSLRSRGKVDVQAIAQRWGGGGHHNAAGFSVFPAEPGEALSHESLFQGVVDALSEAVADTQSPAEDVEVPADV